MKNHSGLESHPASSEVFFKDAEQRGTTLVSIEELMQRAAIEGIDKNKICVIVPRWAESNAREENAQSALVRGDLIVRSDGSAVFLDGMMSLDSMDLAYTHIKGMSNPTELSWEEWTESVTKFPNREK